MCTQSDAISHQINLLILLMYFNLIKHLLQDIVEVLSEKYVPSNYNYDTTNATINLWDDNEKVQNN